MTQQPNYTVGDDTRLYLDALHTFQGFKRALKFALSEQYGEKEGEDMFRSHAAEFGAVEGVVMDYLKRNITANMGTDIHTITI